MGKRHSEQSLITILDSLEPYGFNELIGETVPAIKAFAGTALRSKNVVTMAIKHLSHLSSSLVHIADSDRLSF